jgi:alpha-glucosidase (family GH31 glycosyl hydrolase)
LEELADELPSVIDSPVMPAGWHRRAAVAALSIAGLLVAAPGGAAAKPGGGSLVTEVDDPWGLEFVDGRGRTVLSEAAGTGAGEVGALGLRIRGEWFRATRVASEATEGKTRSLVLETTDPGGRRIEARIAQPRRGVVALDARVVGGGLDGVTATGISFDARGSEHYLGFGERSNAVDQRGNVVESYVSDGPYQKKDYFVPEAVTPKWGFRPRDDATYYPIPWLLSSAGYGVLVDSPETSYFRLDQGGAWSIEVVSAPPGEDAPADAPPPTRLQMRVFAGPKPADVLKRFTRATGRQPPASAPWVFGPWVQPTGGLSEQLEDLELLQASDAPLSLAQTYLHYLPCGDQQGRRDAERGRTAAVHALGLAVTTYFNPMLCTDYQPVYRAAAARRGLDLDPSGDPYVYPYFTSSAFEVSQFDFDQPGGRETFGSVAAEAIADGHDGWMEDFGEYTPLDSHSVAGVPGTGLHNSYPRQYHCGAYDAIASAPRPIVRFQRSGWTGTGPCAQVVWGGDPSTVWGFDGLQSAVRQALTIGLSGISTWGTDIGGFFAIGEDSLSPELLRRWVQFGAVSGVMRTEADGISIPDKPRPQIWDPGQIENWRRYAKLRTQLYPYIAAADDFYQRTGAPIMRHLALRFPGDPRAVEREDEFLFGPDLLVAPVLEPGATKRELYLPKGRWVELWDAVAYKRGSGDLRLGNARPRRGGRDFTAGAAANELPLMVRAGAIVPLLPADVDTLANRYARGGAVSLRDRKRTLELLAFPRGRSGSRAYDDTRMLSRERPGKWVLKLRSAQRRRWRVDASLATLRDSFRPRCVELDGRRLSGKRWSYSKRKRVLHVNVRAKRAEIAALRRC